MVVGHPHGISLVIILGMTVGMIHGIMATTATMVGMILGIRPITTLHGIILGGIIMATGAVIILVTVVMQVQVGAVQESLTTNMVTIIQGTLAQEVFRITVIATV